VANDQPEKFAAIELVNKTGTHVPETLGGWLDKNGNMHGGIEIPDLASLLTGYSPNTQIKGLEAFPADQRPTYRQADVVHYAWDIMVGLGTALALLAVWFGFVWWRKRDLPKTKWFLRAASVAGVASVVALEAGWVVTEVGRQPWIVRGYMKVTQGATTDSGVWVTFLVIVGVYSAVAVTTILVLRSMARRWREGEETSGPYSPRSDPDRTPEPVG
jgi:cytochrome d ubiquinol oxidase subunit I